MLEVWLISSLLFNHLFTLRTMTFFSSLKLGFLILFMIMNYSPLGIPSINLIEIIVVEELLYLLNLLFLLSFSIFLLECLSVEIICQSSLNLLVSGVYIPPNHDTAIVSSLNDFTGNLSPSHAHLIIGDQILIGQVFLLPLYHLIPFVIIFWSLAYLNWSHVLHIPKVTLLTSSPESVHNLMVHSTHPLLKSDHFPISFSFSMCITSDHFPSFKVFNFCKADFDGLCNHLCDIDFTACFASANVNEVWKSVKEAILSSCAQYILTITVKNSPFPRWFSPSIKHSIKKLGSHYWRILLDIS